MQFDFFRPNTDTFSGTYFQNHFFHFFRKYWKLQWLNFKSTAFIKCAATSVKIQSPYFWSEMSDFSSKKFVRQILNAYNYIFMNFLNQRFFFAWKYSIDILNISRFVAKFDSKFQRVLKNFPFSGCFLNGRLSGKIAQPFVLCENRKG